MINLKILFLFPKFWGFLRLFKPYSAVWLKLLQSFYATWATVQQKQGDTGAQLCNPSGRLKPRVGVTSQLPVTSACLGHPGDSAASYLGMWNSVWPSSPYLEVWGAWGWLAGDGVKKAERGQNSKENWDVRWGEGVTDLEENREMGTGWMTRDWCEVGVEGNWVLLGRCGSRSQHPLGTSPPEHEMEPRNPLPWASPCESRWPWQWGGAKTMGWVFHPHLHVALTSTGGLAVFVVWGWRG